MVKVWYNYSELDKMHQIGITYDFENDPWWCWLWFYLGTELGAKRKFMLCPFKMDHWKLLKVYKYHPASETAKLVVNLIKKKVK
jgi:hypothetical protein